MADIQNPRLLYAKGFLFLLLGLTSTAILLIQHPTFQASILLAIVVWSFCRFYYFAFYVVQHYVNDQYRFAGLIDFMKYAWHRKFGKVDQAEKTPQRQAACQSGTGQDTKSAVRSQIIDAD